MARWKDEIGRELFRKIGPTTAAGQFRTLLGAYSPFSEGKGAPDDDPCAVLPDDAALLLLKKCAQVEKAFVDWSSKLPDPKFGGVVINLNGEFINFGNTWSSYSLPSASSKNLHARQAFAFLLAIMQNCKTSLSDDQAFIEATNPVVQNGLVSGARTWGLPAITSAFDSAYFFNFSSDAVSIWIPVGWHMGRDRCDMGNGDMVDTAPVPVWVRVDTAESNPDASLAKWLCFGYLIHLYNTIRPSLYLPNGCINVFYEQYPEIEGWAPLAQQIAPGLGWPAAWPSANLIEATNWRSCVYANDLSQPGGLKIEFESPVQSLAEYCRYTGHTIRIEAGGSPVTSDNWCDSARKVGMGIMTQGSCWAPYPPVCAPLFQPKPCSKPAWFGYLFDEDLQAPHFVF